MMDMKLLVFLLLILVIFTFSKICSLICLKSSLFATLRIDADADAEADADDVLVDAKRRLISSQKTLRIHGGWNSIEDRYSYAQVSLIYKDEGHQCGGSLIAPDVILTASHCKGSFDKIVIGKHRANDRTDLYEMFESSKELIHPMYDEVATRFDTMLVFMNGTSTMAKPVRVNNNDRLPTHGSMLTVIGWGYNQQWDLPDVLQEADVRYTRNSECDDFVDEDGITLDGDLFGDMMCAGSDGRDSCFGDSGSPLILRGVTENEDVQMGLVSWGYECAGHLPGVYSRLSYYHNFEFVEKYVCSLSVQPPNYMDCGKWVPPSKAPSKKPSAAPTKVPTWYPSASPTLQPSTIPKIFPSSLSDLYDTDNIPSTVDADGTSTSYQSASPTTTQLREFLEGTSSVSVSKTSSTILQKQGTNTPNVNVMKESSGAFSNQAHNHSNAVILVVGTICILLSQL